MKNYNNIVDPTSEVYLHQKVHMDRFHDYADKYIPEHLHKAFYMNHMRYEDLVKALFNDPTIKKNLKNRFRNFNVQYVSNIFVDGFFNFGLAGEHIGSEIFYIMGKCYGKNGFYLMFIVYHDGKEFQIFTTDNATEDVYHPDRICDYRYGHLRSSIIKEFNEKVKQAMEDYHSRFLNKLKKQ